MTLPPAGMAPASRSRRAVIEAAGVGLVVVVAHLLLRLSGAFAVGALNDDGVYVALGKAIAEGDGYRSIYLAGAPLHLRYPPGFPLLLALPWALGGTLAAVRATVAALHPLVAGAAAGLVWWTGRRQLELAPASLALCAVAPFLLRSEEHTSELQSRLHLVCRLLLEKKKKKNLYLRCSYHLKCECD